MSFIVFFLRGFRLSFVSRENVDRAKVLRKGLLVAACRFAWLALVAVGSACAALCWRWFGSYPALLGVRAPGIWEA